MQCRFGSLKDLLIALWLCGGLVITTLPASATQSVTLAWNPSTNTDVAGYNVYYGVASGVYTNMASVGNVTNATISGLIEGTTYYFAAKTVSSSGGEGNFSNEASYSVPYQAPALNVISSITVNENAAPQTVNLNGISLGTSTGSQTLSIGAVSSNPALIPNPTVNYTSPNSTGTLTFQPAINASGTATITVTINNGQPQNNSVTRSFTVTVTAVNQPPTMNPINNITIKENASSLKLQLTGITSGAVGKTQTLIISAISSNTRLINAPTVSYTNPNTTGTLTLTPVHNASGAAIITVILDNGGTGNNITAQTFSVSVVALPNPPKIMVQPANVTAVVGKTATFSVSAASSGGTALVYQWQYNSVNLPKATNAVLMLSDVTPNTAGSYSVIVSSSGGQASSSPASLTVYDTTAATLESAVRSSGGFSFTVSGVPGYNYAIQASTNMVDWVAVKTNAAPFLFVDANSGQFNQRFYRSVYVP